jgi:hypothetical protein
MAFLRAGTSVVEPRERFITLALLSNAKPIPAMTLEMRPEPFASSTLTGIIPTPGATPATPVELRIAATIPAT